MQLNAYAKADGEKAKFWSNGQIIEWASGQVASVAVDADEYAYTHGGNLYRAACERIWAEREDSA